MSLHLPSTSPSWRSVKSPTEVNPSDPLSNSLILVDISGAGGPPGEAVVAVPLQRSDFNPLWIHLAFVHRLFNTSTHVGIIVMGFPRESDVNPLRVGNVDTTDVAPPIASPPGQNQL